MKRWVATVLLAGLATVAALVTPSRRASPPDADPDPPRQTPTIALDLPLEDLADSAIPQRPVFHPGLWLAPARQPALASRFEHDIGQGSLRTLVETASCAKGLKAMEDVARESSVQAGVYEITWRCFNESHQRALASTRAQTWSEFALVMEHFEGTPEAMARAIARSPDLADDPAWSRPAVGGLEYRLQRYTDDEHLADALRDRLGDPTVADHLTADLQLEALAAVGLSRVPPEARTPALVDAWARRVYVMSWALRGRPGRLLHAHRGEALELLRGMLDLATVVPPDASWTVPEVVRTARAVGEGHIN